MRYGYIYTCTYANRNEDLILSTLVQPRQVDLNASTYLLTFGSNARNNLIALGCPVDMVQTKKAKTGPQTDAGTGGSGVSLGKGAWDADQNCLIPPEAEVGRSMRSCRHIDTQMLYHMRYAYGAASQC